MQQVQAVLVRYHILKTHRLPILVLMLHLQMPLDMFLVLNLYLVKMTVQCIDKHIPILGYMKYMVIIEQVKLLFVEKITERGKHGERF